MTQELDPKQLRAVAEAATPGRWELVAFDSGHSAYESECAVTVAENGDTIAEMNALSRLGNEVHAKNDGLSDATHIATFDPPTALALLSRLEQAERNFDEADSLKIANESAIERVREIHLLKFYDKWSRVVPKPVGHGGWCNVCGNFDGDACATVRALDGGTRG